MVAFACMVPLAITSTKGWIRRLGRRWQMLHRLIYVSGLAACLHFIWKVKVVIGEPVYYATILLVLLDSGFSGAIDRAGGRAWNRFAPDPVPVSAAPVVQRTTAVVQRFRRASAARQSIAAFVSERLAAPKRERTPRHQLFEAADCPSGSIHFPRWFSLRPSYRAISNRRARVREQQVRVGKTSSRGGRQAGDAGAGPKQTEHAAAGPEQASA